MLDHLGLRPLRRDIEVMAVGNWRVVGMDTAELLASSGAKLIHSAPAFGVKDWSDLFIAVHAGRWLSGARAGDVLEIITDDQAFDAVGDVAAGMGIVFRRLSHRTLTRAGAIAPHHSAARPPCRRRAGRRTHNAARSRKSDTRSAGAPGEAAPDEVVRSVVRNLLSETAGGNVTVDAVALALKARGYGRPPGSLRLITRLRRLSELDVSPRGVIRLRAPADGGER